MLQVIYVFSSFVKSKMIMRYRARTAYHKTAHRHPIRFQSPSQPLCGMSRNASPFLLGRGGGGGRGARHPKKRLRRRLFRFLTKVVNYCFDQRISVIQSYIYLRKVFTSFCLYMVCASFWPSWIINRYKIVNVSLSPPSKIAIRS